MPEVFPRVSICIPASRPTPYFLDALDSALAQTMDDFEIIVTDDSGGQLEPLVRSRNDPRIKYYDNPHRLGLAGNHCRALDEATGTMVAFLHDDDVWCRDYLATASRVLEADEDLGLVLTDMVEIDTDGREIGLRPSGMTAGVQVDPLDLFLRRQFIALIPSASLFRRAALKNNLRPWPDVQAGDLTMYLDCVLNGWGVYHLAEPLIRYRVHAGQISRNSLPLQTAVITVFGSYAFADPHHERLRLRRVASAHVARAAAHLGRGEARLTRAELRTAWRVRPGERAVWAVTILLLSWLPRSLYVRAERLYRAVRLRRYRMCG